MADVADEEMILLFVCFLMLMHALVLHEIQHWQSSTGA